MPLYQLECAKCGNSVERYLALRGDPNPKCEMPDCGGETERVWAGRQRGATSIFPYVTTHLTGQPIEIKSASHLRSLEKQHGVRLRDDAAYTDKRWDGYDFKTRQHRYSEGSGRGMPGSWV